MTVSRIPDDAINGSQTPTFSSLLLKCNQLNCTHAEAQTVWLYNFFCNQHLPCNHWFSKNRHCVGHCLRCFCNNVDRERWVQQNNYKRFNSDRQTPISFNVEIQDVADIQVIFSPAKDYEPTVFKQFLFIEKLFLQVYSLGLQKNRSYYGNLQSRFAHHVIGYRHFEVRNCAILSIPTRLRLRLLQCLTLSFAALQESKLKFKPRLCVSSTIAQISVSSTTALSTWSGTVVWNQ